MYDKEFADDNLPERQALEGTIAADVSDPDDDLFVHLPQFDDDSGPKHKHGPVKGWSTHDGSYPNEGDEALVIVGDQGSIWLINWKAL